MIRALVLHPDFAATPPANCAVRSNFSPRFTARPGPKITGTTNAHQWQLMRAGWRQHEYPIPTGHPDVMAKWTGASSLNRLVDFALYAHDDWFGVVSLDLAGSADETTGAFLDRWSGRLGTTGLAAQMGLDPALPAASFTPEERWGAAAGALAFAALTPAFLLR